MALDPSNGKQYVVKECFKGKTEEIQKLLAREPKNLEKVKKYRHPNLQNLITWFGDSFGNIIIVIEFIDGKIFDQLLVASP